jgi:CopG family nickel-responsive transcriptional regulator
MQRVTVTLDDELMDQLDQIIADRGYQNRSEAIRDLARSGILQASEVEDSKKDCVAALVYTYDHNVRELAKRLTQNFHDHSDMSLASMHVHLDHDQCMEINILKGNSGAVRHFAEHVIAERGVRHGRVVVVPNDTVSQGHSHTHTHGSGDHHSHADHSHGTHAPTAKKPRAPAGKAAGKTAGKTARAR